LPAISVPSGFASSGVPTGIQVIGKTYDDLSVFRAAYAFESAHDWWTRKRPAQEPGPVPEMSTTASKRT
jgi:Asp-tRNA(Asn)/Glu-tRNA(Gln) amidotransferase A subunit family amidase